MAPDRKRDAGVLRTVVDANKNQSYIMNGARFSYSC